PDGALLRRGCGAGRRRDRAGRDAGQARGRGPRHARGLPRGPHRAARHAVGRLVRHVGSGHRGGAGMSTVETAPGAVSAPAPHAESSLLGVYRQPAPVFVEGRGSRVYDAEGHAYLDFISGIGVNAFGYADPGIAEAVQSVLETALIHTSNLFRTAPAERLAAELTRLSFADRVFFCNSGGEAVEAAFKFARRRARESGDVAKTEFVALHGSFHGRL